MSYNKMFTSKQDKEKQEMQSIVNSHNQMLMEKDDEIDMLKQQIFMQKRTMLDQDAIIKELQSQVTQLHTDQDLCLECKSNMNTPNDKRNSMRMSNHVPLTRSINFENDVDF